MTQLIEKTNILELKQAFNSHIEGTKPFTCNNSVHCTLTLASDRSINHAQTYVEAWMDAVAQTLRTGQHGITYFGALFLQPCMHLHLALRTVRSRKTGQTISRIPEAARDSLCAFWEGMAGETARLETIYNMPGLLLYLKGNHNAGRPGQEMYFVSN